MAEHSTEILLTPARHLVHSCLNFFFPCLLFFSLLMCLDWKRVLWAYKMPLNWSLSNPIEKYWNSYTGRPTWLQTAHCKFGKRSLCLYEIQNCTVDVSTSPHLLQTWQVHSEEQDDSSSSVILLRLQAPLLNPIVKLTIILMKHSMLSPFSFLPSNSVPCRLLWYSNKDCTV